MPLNTILRLPPKILVICGPTATGKTTLALELAKIFDGELVSADSRQIYTGKNLIHGKDLPPNLKPQDSSLKWHAKNLKYYEIKGVKIWLYDVVEPGEEFNVSYWRECADLVIKSIFLRKKLPIIVGGSGLYIKSLITHLDNINIPPNKLLREKLENKSAKYLFNYLNKLDSFKAASLNVSDRHNPRRLIRAIETSLVSPSPELRRGGWGGEVLQIGLTAPNTSLYQLIDHRILTRIQAGAASEDPHLAGRPQAWQHHEHRLARQQLTWFKKQTGITWFDVSNPGWQTAIIKLCRERLKSPPGQ